MTNRHLVKSRASTKFAISAVTVVCTTVAVAIFLLSYFPTLAMFPYKKAVGNAVIYSEYPISDEIEQIITRSEYLVLKSPLYESEGQKQKIFLTNGEVRWQILTMNSDALAISRPITEPIVVNRSSMSSDQVWSGSVSPSSRDLSGVIAHEKTHGLIRRKFGVLASRSFPDWVVEGYCDYVSGRSSLTGQQATRLIAQGQRPPALFYYESRNRVERALASNGGSVVSLFEVARTQEN